MDESDEPILEGTGERQPLASDQVTSEERIRRLAMRQPYGVLCTQSQGQPYGSMVAFAFADDLGSFVFATPRATRKYRLLTECHSVALVVNDQADSPHDLMKISAFTVTGKAREVAADTRHTTWARRLESRHPQLAHFIAAPSTALFVVDVVRFFLVHSFQEVRQWAPTAGGTR